MSITQQDAIASLPGRLQPFARVQDHAAHYAWRDHALVVDGFIPPAVFMEFQARRVLVIALDMREKEHSECTPTPSPGPKPL